MAKANCYNLMGLANYNLGIYNEAIRSYHNAMHIAQCHEPDGHHGKMQPEYRCFIC